MLHLCVVLEALNVAVDLVQIAHGLLMHPLQTRHLNHVTVNNRGAVLVHRYMRYKCIDMCLQCFDAVGWAAGRASGL